VAARHGALDGFETSMPPFVHEDLTDCQPGHPFGS
jgi:hypothetical protein